VAVITPPAVAEPGAPPRRISPIAPRPWWTLERRRRAADVAAAVLTVAAAAAYAAVSMYRFNHFGANGFDLGIQDQTVWGYGQLQVIPNTVEGVPNLLADHFNPILVVLAPFRRLWDSAGALLVAQAILLAIAGIPIYLWAAQRLGRLAGLAFQASYLVFWGVLAGVMFDFHHVVFAVPAISAALYATLNRHNRLLWAMVAVMMLTREDLALTVAALGLYMAVVQRRWVLGAALAVLNGAWLVLLLDAVMPALGGTPYQHWTYQALGTGPVSAFVFLVEHPLKSLELLVTPVQKLRVGIGTLATWIFVPLLSPILIVAVPSFLERFWSTSSDLWSFHFQYSMLPAPILAFAAIDGAARLGRLPLGRTARAAATLIPLGALLASIFLSAFVVRPLAELGTYVSDAAATQIQQCIDEIPQGASVAATDALVPHLTSRREIYEVTSNAGADWIALDLRTLGSLNPSDAQLRGIVQGAMNNGYGVVCSKGYTVVLAKGRTPGRLSPELQRWLTSDCSGAVCISQP
jgi:uncharacterized membrane protein